MRDACRVTTDIRVAPSTDDGERPAVRRRASRRASTASAAMVPGRRTSTRSNGDDVEAARRAIVNPGHARSRAAARDLHAVPSRVDEQSAAVSDPPLRARAVFVRAGKAARAITSFTSITRQAPGRDDKFEIAGGAYRLRKSACFQRSEMTCVTCHNPHDVPRGAEAVQALRRGLSELPHEHASLGRARASRTSARRDLPRLPYAEAAHGGCRSRGDDRPLHSAANDRARRSAGRSHGRTDRGSYAYRGEVVPVLPADACRRRPENELYLAVAQVQHGSNLTAGIPRLEQRDRAAPPGAPGVLLRARSRVREDGELMTPPSGGAARRSRATPRFVPALKELAGAPMATGQARRSRAGAREGGRAAAGAMRMRSRISATCTCSRAVWMRPNGALRARARARSGYCRGRTTPWGWRSCARETRTQAEPPFPRGDSRAARPGRGAQQSRQSARGPPCL